MSWSACEACPHQKQCWCSGWNEHGERPPGHTSPPECDGLKNVSSVHTCFTCGERVFDFFEPYEGDRLVVPQDCPRWNSLQGSMTDCGGCRADREAVKRTHPNYGRKMEAAKGALEALFAGVQAKREGDDLGAQRASQAFGKGLTEADSPRHWLPGMLAEHPELVQPADTLLGAVVASVLNHEAVVPEWSRHEDWQHRMYLARWSQAALLAVLHHPRDPEKAVWEMWLEVSDTPSIRRGLCRGVGVSERERLRRSWCSQLTKVSPKS
jgi:hypothetical protein